jgi:hypothetical protein
MLDTPEQKRLVRWSESSVTFSYQGGLRRTDPTFRNLVLHSMDGKFAGHLNRYAPELHSSQLSYPESAKADEVRSLTCFVVPFCRI